MANERKHTGRNDSRHTIEEALSLLERGLRGVDGNDEFYGHVNVQASYEAGKLRHLIETTSRRHKFAD